MTPEPNLISIVLTFYNPAVANLEATIKSILAQTCDRWELLLVDDGSTNESSQLACDYALLYPQYIRYLEHERHLSLGVSASYNLGIEQAQGGYISFLSANQTWLANKLSYQLGILEKYPQVQGVFGFQEYTTVNLKLKNKQQRNYWNQHFNQSLDQVNQPPHLASLLLLNHPKPFSLSNILLRRDTFNQTGVFDLRLNTVYALDGFLLQLCLNSTIFVHRQPLIVYANSWQDALKNKSPVESDRYPNSASLAHRVYWFWLENYLTSYIDSNQPSDQLESKTQSSSTVMTRQTNSALNSTCQLIHRQLFPQRYSWLGKSYTYLKKIFLSLRLSN